MKHAHCQEDSAEQAALYATGALPHAERVQFETHLESGCPACQAELAELNSVVSTLAGALSPLNPSPQTRAALLQRIASAKPATTASPLRQQVERERPKGERRDPLFIQRAADATWQDTEVKGVQVRVLSVDAANNQFSALVRMAPGTLYPGHTHSGPEECLVLEGDLHVGDTVMGPGDYQRAPVGSRHGVQSTERGCLLYITSGLNDVFA